MSEWQKVKIGNIATESKIHETNPDANKKIRVRLNVNGVEKRPLIAEKEGATKNYKRKAGQFIYGRQNFHKGAFGVVPSSLDGFSSSGDLPAFDIDDSCLPEWMLYWFKTESRYLQLLKQARGIGSQRIATADFYKTEILLPDVTTQQRIINKIQSVEKNTFLFESEISNQQTYLTKLRQAILQEAIEGKLTADWRVKNPVAKGNPNTDAGALLATIKAEKQKLIAKGKIKKEKPLVPINSDDVPFALPDGWVWVKLGAIIKESPKNGYSPKEVDYPTTVKSLKLGATTLGVFNPNKFKYIDEDIPEDSFLWLEKNDILIQRSNSIDYVGVSAIYKGEKYQFIYPDLMMKIQMFSPISPFFAYLFLSAFSTRSYFRSLATGSQKSMPKINQDTVLNVLVGLPPLAEQHAIVERVDCLLASVNALELHAQERKTYAEQLMQAVLKEAFAG